MAARGAKSTSRCEGGRATGVRIESRCEEMQSDDYYSQTVEGAALALEGVDDVERGDGLALGMLGVLHAGEIKCQP